MYWTAVEISLLYGAFYCWKTQSNNAAVTWEVETLETDKSNDLRDWVSFSY